MSLLTTMYESMRETTVHTKTQTTPDKWIGSSVQVHESGFGHLGGKPWPFNYRAAMVQLQGWVYACAMGNARTAASFPLRLFVRAKRNRKSDTVYHPSRKRDDGSPCKLVHPSCKPNMRTLKYLKGQLAHGPSDWVRGKVMAMRDDLEEVTEHPLLKVFRAVNPDMDGYQFAVLRFASQEITGNFYIHPIMGHVLGRLQPIALYGMLPHWVEVKVHQPPSSELIEGYAYGADLSVREEFAPDEVVHFKYVNPRDLIYGLGKVEAAWSVIHLQHAQRESDIAFFQNNARPDYLVINKSGVTGDQMDRFDTKINKMLRGARNAHKFLSITGDVTVQPMQFPPKDVPLNPAQLEELAAITGWPITKLKGNDPNRANAEQGDLTHKQDTILPMLRGDEQVINQWLATFDEQFANGDAFFAYDDPVPANRAAELAEATAAIAGGWRTRDEQRIMDNEEPIGGNADKLIVPAGMTTIDKVGEPVGLGFNFGQPSPAAPSGITIGAQPMGDQPSDEEAQNIVAGEKLNGAQITAAQGVLADLANGQMPATVASELLVAVGIDEAKANRMVSATEAFEPTALPDGVTSGKMRRNDNPAGGNLGRNGGGAGGRDSDDPADAVDAPIVHGKCEADTVPGDDRQERLSLPAGRSDRDDTQHPDSQARTGQAAKSRDPDGRTDHRSDTSTSEKVRRYTPKMYPIPPGAALVAREALARKRMESQRPPDIHLKVEAPPQPPAPVIQFIAPEQPPPVVQIENKAPDINLEPVIQVNPKITIQQPDKHVKFNKDKHGLIDSADIQVEGE